MRDTLQASGLERKIGQGMKKVRGLLFSVCKHLLHLRARKGRPQREGLEKIKGYLVVLPVTLGSKASSSLK